MPRRCSIREHTECEAINEAIINNGPLRTTADRYGVSKTALIRHKQNHIPDLLAKAAGIRDGKEMILAEAAAELVQAREDKEQAQADSLLRLVKQLITDTRGIYERAEGAGDLRTALQAIREARGNFELLGKLIGEIQEGVNLNFYASPDWAKLKALILLALEPYPEAKEARIHALSSNV